MNMRSFAVVLGAITAASFATVNFTACIITGSGGSSVGGSGGSSSSSSASSTSTSTSTTSSSTSTTTSTSTSTSSSSGGTMCDMKYTCADAIDPMTGDPKKLCDGTDAAKAYDALAACTCMGACMKACGMNVCMNMALDATCTACLQDTMNGCGKEFETCAAN